MLIRRMNLQDIDRMIQKLPEWLRGHPAYADYTIDLDHTTYYVDMLWEAFALYGLVLEEDGEIVGCLAFTVAPPMFSPDLEAVEVLFFIEEQARGLQAYKLLSKAKQYVQELGARRFYMGAKSGHRTEALQKLYIRAGFAPTGGEYCWTRS